MNHAQRLAKLVDDGPMSDVGPDDRETIALAAEGMALLAKLPIPTGPDVCGEEE